MSKYYKGYTQKLISTISNDVDPGAMSKYCMTPGLFLMKQLQQEGYILPVCKFINNIRRDVLESIPVATDGPSYHPQYDYAEIDNGLKLVNLLEIPTEIAGGIVVLTNIMKSSRVPRYYKLDDGNLVDLVANQSIKIIMSTRTNDAEGMIALVNKSCILETSKVKYIFEFTSKDEVYTDFIATIEEL